MLRLQVHHPLSISQPDSYHHFVDQRGYLGIPNFLNVVSNLPFAIIGIWGMFVIFPAGDERRRRFTDPRERWPYLALFIGLCLTCFGSAYYHLAPGNATLVWDRLPMSIMFGGLVAAVVSEKIDVTTGVRLLPIFLLFSVGCVLQWYYSELHGQGDLRWYAAVQIYSVLVLLSAPFIHARYSRDWDFMIAFAFYGLAKIFESLDRTIYSLGHIVSGHTLKHFAAAAAGYWIMRMLQQRVPCPAEFIAR
jgi:hypothetical protein